jgi:hypothetical protein
MALSLNQKQQKVIDCGIRGESLSVDSAPGSGKSFTLRNLAYQLPSVKGRYLVYNDSAANEARHRFPGNFKVSTIHSLALSCIDQAYREKLGFMNNHQIVDFLDIKPSSFAPPLVMASFISDTLSKFCQSTDRYIKDYHVPPIRDLSDSHTQKRKEQIAVAAAKIFDSARDINSPVPVSHDIYLKIFQLGHYQLGLDTIMLDEAQDANPVMWDVITNQKDTQLIVVGDRFQQLNAFRGAINVMDMMPGATRINMNQSYRLGSEMVNVCNTVLNNHLHSDYRVEGNPNLKSWIGNSGKLEDLHLFRTNMGLLSDLFDYTQNRGHKVHVVGGTKEIKGLILNCEKLKRGERPRSGELSRFADWDSFIDYADSPAGRHLYKFKSISEKFDVDQLLTVLEKVDSFGPKKADCVFSTVHKAKGMEAASARIAGDFKDPSSKRFNKEEGNVYYVATTRSNRLNETAVRSFIKTMARYEAKNEKQPRIKRRQEVKKTFDKPVQIDNHHDIAPF